jgi:glutamate-1-semialdehyde 2,1-aminomutase
VQELCGIAPDLTALGKVIGGGLPVGAFGGRADQDQLAEWSVYQAGTLSGNPLAMAAGLAQLRELDRINGWAKLESWVPLCQARAALRKLDATIPLRGLLMFCLYFYRRPLRNLTDAYRADKAAFARYFHGCLKGGVYFAPSQFEAGFLSLAHTMEDLEKTGAVAAEALVA